MSEPSVRFGGTGLRVSRLALGTMTFGFQTDEPVAAAILDKAVGEGITLIDTADVYPLGGGAALAGRTEEIVGRWLAGRRGDVVLATKAFGSMGPKPWNQGNSRKHLLDAIDASLRRLRTDYVDLYQLHGDDPDTPLDETLEALDLIVRTGRARYVGVSNFLAYRLARLLGRADTLRWARPVSVQPRYSLLFREIERELLPLAREEGLGVIPYNPLAGGMLTGKHRRDAPPADGTRFALGNAARRYQDRYWADDYFETVDRLGEVARDAGLSLVTLSIAWVMAQPGVTAPLLGASRPEQLDEALAARDLRLDADLLARLDALTRGYRMGDAAR